MQTCDLGLWVSFLDYFVVVASPCTWDHGSLDYFIIFVSTHTWDLGLLLYIFTTIIEGNYFQREMDCWDPP